MAKLKPTVRSRNMNASPQPVDDATWKEEMSSGNEQMDDDEIIHLAVKKSQKAWSASDDGSIFYGIGNVYDKIVPALYKCAWSDNVGFHFRKLISSVDSLIEFPDSESQMVIDQIKQFWKLKDEFKERGFLHKRGILMYGEPGSGKTSTIQQLIKLIINAGGIAVYADRPDFLSGCLQMLRRIEPEKPVIVIIEDFETLIEERYRENEWLAILDGESQVDNVVFVATTNYIEKLDKRIKDRPSRFDMIVPVYMPSAQSRAIFLKKKEPNMSMEELQEWVKKTKGFSVAHLKELLISVKCYGHTLDETVHRLNRMRKRDANNEQLEKASGTRESIGFGSPVAVQDERENIDWEKFKEWIK